jgi:uncharacterized protein YbjT (DUF2867 family)
MDARMKPVLVTGATGTTGSALVKLLSERGVPVRAMVRRELDVTRVGATPESVVVADFDDSGSLAAAVDGVGRAYLVTPSSEAAEAQQTRFAEIAARAGVELLVKLSQFAADEASPVRFLRWHAAVERRIRALGIDFTFLRPNLYFQGLLAFSRSIATESRFFAPIGNARISAVDIRDIADVAAAALTEDGHQGRTYTITGPAAISHGEVAAALSRVLGREITFIDAPPDVFAESLREVLPAWQLDGLLEDYAHYARGEAETVHSTVAEVTGHPPRDIDQFARDYAGAFLRS